MAHIGQCEDCENIDIVEHVPLLNANLCPKCLADICEVREWVIRMAFEAILVQQIRNKMKL